MPDNNNEEANLRNVFIINGFFADAKIGNIIHGMKFFRAKTHVVATWTKRESNSILIQFSPDASHLAFPRDDGVVPGRHADIAAGRPPPETGKNLSGTSCLLYLRFYQKYW